KWKIEAASTAVAWPSRIPSTRCSSVPTPPEAMMGIRTESAIARVKGISKPALVPSRSIEVTRSSPAPSAAMRLAQSTASSPVPRRPPWVKTPHWPAAVAFASIATTMHWLPNFSAASRTKSGRATAAVLIDTLSAPASSNLRMSSTVRTPPPTVSGMKHCSAVRLTTSYSVSRPSWLAVMSRKHNSSAPSLSYSRACSTGSPASTRSTKLTPLTTRPAVTSRQGMTRIFSMRRSRHRIGFAGEDAGVIALGADRLRQRAARIQIGLERGQHAREIVLRPPAQLLPRSLVDIDPADAGKHLPAAPRIFRFPARDMAADDARRAVAQIVEIVAGERRRRRNDVFAETERRGQMRGEQMRAHHVGDIDAAIQELVGFDVAVGIGIAHVAIVVGFREKARRAQHDAIEAVVAMEQLAQILRRGLGHAIDVLRHRRHILGDPRGGRALGLAELGVLHVTIVE